VITKLSIENGGEIDDALRVDNFVAMDSEQEKKEMGRRLRHVRKEVRDWSQDDLAERAGVAKAQISNCENGNRGLAPKALFAVAKALGVRPQWLLSGEDPMVGDDEPGSELERAVVFLRGQLPAAFLDDALATEFYQGEQWSRDQLVPMIRAAYAARVRDGERDDTDEVLEIMSRPKPSS
jgi:transcriptional regulator with XRE-family HTH domain